MKKRIVLFLLLLFALAGTIWLASRLVGNRFGRPQTDSSAVSTEETAESTEETTGETSEPVTEEPEQTEDEETSAEPSEEKRPGPGEPVEREKVATELIFASDIHYMSPETTDYGHAFEDLIDRDDGKVLRYIPQIWQAFAEEVVMAGPDALILSGDLTLNGEKKNHEALAAKLSELQAEGVRVLVVPGNHDIENPNAAVYFDGEMTDAESVTAEEFREIYGAFGYNDAASYAPDSLSYLYILNDTTWLMMLDTCIYDPENEVDGEIREGTLAWMEECLKEAYAQGITVIPVGHHNLQELSRVYVEECVLRNHEEVLDLLEYYLTPVYLSGHLHAQRIMKHMREPGEADDIYGIWEIVSNSLSIAPCQYGCLALNTDGSLSFHTENVNVSSWAAKHGDTNEELLNFAEFSDEYLRSVISRQIYKKIDEIPDYIREEMADFYADLCRDYYAGRQVSYSEMKKEYAYGWWERFMNPSLQFRRLDGMLRDGMAVNTKAEIPNPITQQWR